MRLSEMTLEQTRIAMIRLAVPFGNICDDEDFVKLLDEYKGYYRLPMIMTIGKVLPKLTVHCFDKHYADLLEIVSVFAEKPVEECKKLGFPETIKIIRDNYDDLSAAFFPSSGAAKKRSAKG